MGEVPFGTSFMLQFFLERQEAQGWQAGLRVSLQSFVHKLFLRPADLHCNPMTFTAQLAAMPNSICGPVVPSCRCPALLSRLSHSFHVKRLWLSGFLTSHVLRSVLGAAAEEATIRYTSPWVA